jgi:hypothetical protein
MPLLKEEVEGNWHVCPTDLRVRLVRSLATRRLAGDRKYLSHFYMLKGK